MSATRPRASRKTMAVFSSLKQAEEVQKHVTEQIFGGDSKRVALIEPDDPQLDVKLQTEFTQMGHIAVASHIWSAIIGIAVGAGLWGIFYLFKNPIVVNEVATSLLGFICVCLLIGVLIGCVIAYMPSQDVLSPTRNAIEEGKWVVVAYPDTASEAKEAIHYFQSYQ